MRLQVEYHVETFCDKNKDELPKESDELFASSGNDFVVNLFAPAGGKLRHRSPTSLLSHTLKSADESDDFVYGHTAGKWIVVNRVPPYPGNVLEPSGIPPPMYLGLFSVLL